MRDDDNGKDERWQKLATALISGLLGIAITLFGMLLGEAKEIKTQMQAIAMQNANLQGQITAIYDRLAVSDAARIRGEKR